MSGIYIKGIKAPRNCHECDAFGISDIIGLGCEKYAFSHRPEGCPIIEVTLSPEQPKPAKIIIGKSKDGIVMWYQCDTCNEPIDKDDLFCRGCGRRLVHGSD